MAEKDAADVLEEAADYLLIHGRCLETEDADSEKVCVLGAIGFVRHDDPYAWAGNDLDGDPAVIALARTITPRRFHPGRWEGVAPEILRVFSWNDSEPDDDVVRDALLLAAKDLRAEAVPE